MSAASSSASRSMCEMRSLMVSKVGAGAVAALRRSASISPCIAESWLARSADRATGGSRSGRAMRKSASSRSIVSATWCRSNPRRTTSNECWASCIGIMSRCASLMRSSSQTSPERRAWLRRWPRARSVGTTRPGTVRRSDAAEAVDLGLVAGAFVGVADAEAFGGGQAEHADLALVQVAVHVVGGLADLGHRIHPGQGGGDQAAVDQPVGLPGLPVVGEVAADDPFEVHPQVAVVVLVLIPRRGGAGVQDPAAFGPVHAGAEVLPAGVLEDDVGILPAGQRPDLLAQPLPLL